MTYQLADAILDPTAVAGADAMRAGFEGQLGPDDIDQFRADGYASFSRLFAFDEIAWLRHEAEAAALRGGSGRARAYEAPEGTIYGLHGLEPAFRRLAAHPRLLAEARRLLGSEVYIHQSRLVPRERRIATDAVWRNDFSTWSAVDGMADPGAVTAAVFLGDAGLVAPSLHVVPGSHRQGAWTSDVGVSGGIGDVLFYDANLSYSFNRAGENRTLPIFLVSYNRVSNHAVGARGGVYVARSANPPVQEADDCLWPSAWCVAG